MSEITPDVGTDSQATPAAVPAPAPAPEPAKGDDLDSILANVIQYREETQRDRGDDGRFRQSTEQQRQAPAEQQQRPAQRQEQAPEPARLHAIELRLVREDIGRAVENMRSSSAVLKGIPDSALEGYLNVEAQRDPRIMSAWEQRHRDPTTFNRVVQGLGQRFAKTLPPAPDPRADAERASALAAGRGSTRVETAADAEDRKITSMPSGDFAEYRRNLPKSA